MRESGWIVYHGQWGVCMGLSSPGAMLFSEGAHHYDCYEPIAFASREGAKTFCESFFLPDFLAQGSLNYLEITRDARPGGHCMPEDLERFPEVARFAPNILLVKAKREGRTFH